MTNRVMKIIGTAALSISLITGASNAVSANEMSPSSLKDKLTWDLKGNTIDPTNTYSVTIGYPNIKLYSKNTGAISYRIEVMHNSKKRVIFNETVAAGKTVEVVNNNIIT
jgi:hypothetical protein